MIVVGRQLQLARGFTKESYKPVRVKIPHSLYNDSGLEYSICYFCVTNYKEEIESFLQDNKIAGLDRVLSMKDVQKYYKTYNDMKRLLNEHTHFICDAAILRQLYNFIGPVFGAKHKMPVQIHNSKASDLPKEVEKVINSSYIHLGGDNISMKIGHTKQTAQQVADNVVAGVDFLAGKIPGSWSNVLSINLRLAQSAAIPVYSKRENELVEYLQSQVKKQQITKQSQSQESKTPAKGEKTPAKAAKKAETAATPAPAPSSAKKAAETPAAVTTEKTPAKSAKKVAAKEATTPAAVVPPPAPVSAAKSAKKVKAAAAVVVEEEAPLPPAPKSAAKAKVAKEAAAPVSATKSAKKASKMDVDVVEEETKKAPKVAGARPTGIPKLVGKKK